MRRTLITLAVALAAATTHVAHAADDKLYRAFGEKAGISALMTDFVGRLKTDKAIGVYFKDTKAAYLAQQLADQVCKLTGGPCEYEGAPMRESHRDLDIDRAAFNRLVEVLQDTMNDRGIAFSTQNALLARLAPMHRDIVTR